MQELRKYIIEGIFFLTLLVAAFVDREHWIELTSILICFGAFAAVLNNAPSKIFRWWVFLAHLVMIFAIPNLSDDYYRFYWDAAVWDMGNCPFDFIPQNHPLELTPTMQECLIQMNSSGYYSVYPAINQWLYRFAYFFSKEHLYLFTVVLGTILFTFNLLTYNIIKRKWGREVALLFLANPLLILESSNLHFEIIVLTGLAAFLYFDQRSFYSWSGLFIAIGVKLHPLLFLPSIIDERKRSSLIPITITMILFIGSLIQVISLENISNYLISLRLYFQTFEFNGGLFYLVRSFGFWIYGWDIIQTAGPVLALLSLSIIVVISFMKIGLAEKLFWSYFIFLLFSSIVHPWYVLVLLPLGLWSKNPVGSWFTFLVTLSYASYSVNGVEENLWLIATEYLVLTAIIGLYFAQRFSRLSFFLSQLLWIWHPCRPSVKEQLS